MELLHILFYAYGSQISQKNKYLTMECIIINDPNRYGGEFLKKDVPKCTTIDRMKDDGYLNRARNIIKFEHEKTEYGVSNLLNCVGQKESIAIIGHGENGRFGMGCGRNFDETHKEQYIDTLNIAEWEGFFKQLQKKDISNLYLIGCNPGASVEGALLLYTLAQLVNAPVIGPTGFITCDDNVFKLEPCSTWQIATPTIKPAPIEPPSHDIPPLTNLIIIYTQFQSITFQIESVISISIFMPPQFAQTKMLEKNEILDFLSMIDFANPIDLPGDPASLIGGIFIIDFEYNRDNLRKEYYVLNNRLIQDKQFPLKAYYCKESIGSYFKRENEF
jgi:hypothetical protein